MQPRPIERFPQSGDWLAEPKYDGWRCVGSVRDDGAVVLYSRRGTDLTDAFPEVVSALYSNVKPGTTLDGELLRWQGGRLDLGGLQRRWANRRRARDLAAGEPVHYAVFDAIAIEGRDLRARPLTARRWALERLLHNVGAGSGLEVGLQTADRELAMDWFGLSSVGIEGLVLKPAASKYVSGNNSIWRKMKNWVVTTAIVGGITGTLRQPDSLLLGRYTEQAGRLRIAGRTSRIADPALSAAIGELLAPAGPGHPWPDKIPAAAIFGSRGPLAYTRVEPRVVVEIRADAAVDLAMMRWRHVTRLLRPRAELRPQDVPRELDIG